MTYGSSRPMAASDNDASRDEEACFWQAGIDAKRAVIPANILTMNFRVLKFYNQA